MAHVATVDGRRLLFSVVLQYLIITTNPTAAAEITRPRECAVNRRTAAILYNILSLDRSSDTRYTAAVIIPLLLLYHDCLYADGPNAAKSIGRSESSAAAYTRSLAIDCRKHVRVARGYLYT